MIPFELALWYMTQPCVSDIHYEKGGQIVVMCPRPEMQGPKIPPWLKVVLEQQAAKAAEPKAVPRYVYPAKKTVKKATAKKPPKKKRRRRG